MPNNSDKLKKLEKPFITPDDKEKECCNLAVTLAEKQLREGTASAQVITHYLKLCSQREKLENEILKQKHELMKAQTDSVISQQRDSDMAEEAMAALKRYTGHMDEEYEELP